mmetsp:Transcript_53156/g.53565  ORF Transcript_53156/g.53565 Transcript_53156/m.53565 type:complete len:376 (-) Transcript_53156:446-1573(-)
MDTNVTSTTITNLTHPLVPGESRVYYHRPPWKEPSVTVVAVAEASSLSPAAVTDSSNGLPSSVTINGNNFNEHSCTDTTVLKILYYDEHLMAVHKPSGLPTMPSQTYYRYTVLHALRSINDDTINDKLNDNHHPLPTFLAPPQPVHRLGVGTSGLLLVATSHPARSALSRAIRDRRVTKVYRALVVCYRQEGGGSSHVIHEWDAAAVTVARDHVDNGCIPDRLRIYCPIGPVPFPISGDTIHAARPCPKDGEPTIPAKDALSLVRVISRNRSANTAVVEIAIPTGRPHQIRIHMAYAEYPLVGDPLYQSGGIHFFRNRGTFQNKRTRRKIWTRMTKKRKGRRKKECCECHCQEIMGIASTCTKLWWNIRLRWDYG